jgi:ribose 5-phosphate isomerase B
MDRAEIRRHVREVLTQKLASAAPAPSAGAAATTAPIAHAATSARSTSPAPRGRDLVAEEDVYRARAAGRDVVVRPGAIITPLARETAARFRVRIVEAEDAAPKPSTAPVPAAAPQAAATASAAPPAATVFRKIAFASDHGGFPLKEKLRAYAAEALGVHAVDLGTKSEAAVDYPDFAHAAAALVQRGEVEAAVVVDGAGLGSAMAANRRRGVRAATCLTILQALNAREHNDANVLCLGGRHLGEDAAKAVFTAFVRTAFAGGRHQARVAKIDTGAS